MRILPVVLFALIFSRGIFELLGSKILGYAFGLTSVFLLVCVSLSEGFKYRKSIKIPLDFTFITFLIYSIFVFLSLFATVLNNIPILVGLLYSSLHIFFLGSLVMTKRNSGLTFNTLSAMITVVSGIIIVSGLLEFFDIVSFPAESEFQGFARLVGSLGSKQHFSFASASLGMIALWFFLESQRKYMLFLSIVLVALTFLSFSRNGMPIVFGTLLLNFFGDFKTSLIKMWKPVFATVLGLITFVFMLSQNNNLSAAIIQRFFSIFILDSPGNAGRVDAWERGLSTFSQGLIVIGNNTGLYSQAGSRLGLGQTYHFESAVLQQFANFGIIGGLAFVFFFISFCFSFKDVYLRSLAIMTSLTYIYYPGSESIPFIGAWLAICFCECSKYGLVGYPRTSKNRFDC
jgi:hypothetical protein